MEHFSKFQVREAEKYTNHKKMCCKKEQIKTIREVKSKKKKIRPEVFFFFFFFRGSDGKVSAFLTFKFGLAERCLASEWFWGQT